MYIVIRTLGSKDYCNKAQITTSASENEASQNQNKEKTDFSKLISIIYFTTLLSKFLYTGFIVP